MSPPGLCEVLGFDGEFPAQQVDVREAQSAEFALAQPCSQFIAGCSSRPRLPPTQDGPRFRRGWCG